MKRILFENFDKIIISKYRAKKIEENEKFVIYEISESLILDYLFNSEEKQKLEKRKKQMEETYGKVPYDENINIGKLIEVRVNFIDCHNIKNFEISPICDYLFNELIVIIGVNNEDSINLTGKYKRYLAAKKYIEKEAQNKRIESEDN